MRVDLQGVQSLNKSQFIFPDKGLSLVFGDNSVGKSSIIRAITAAISYDSNSKDPRIAEEQRLLGILQDKSSSSLGLIQVGKDDARIDIDGPFVSQSAVISRNGKYKGSTPRFVITNVLSDVSWIMRVLTHTSTDKVNDYLQGFNEMILRYDDVVDTATEMKIGLLDKIKDLNRMLRESAEAQKVILEDRKNLEEVATEIRAIQERIKQEARKDPDREKRISDLNSQIAEKEKEISEISKLILGFEGSLREINNHISERTSQISEQEEKRENLFSQLKEYEEVDTNSLEETEARMEDLKAKRSKEQLLYEILRRTQSMLDSEHSHEVKCPLCGSINISQPEIKRIALEKDGSIRAFDAQISRLTREVGSMNEIVKRRKEISQQIPGIEISLDRLKDDLKHDTQDREESQLRLENEEKERTRLEQQKNKLVLATSDENPEREKQLKELQEQERKLRENIKDVELSRKYSQINIFGINFPVETKTLDVFDKAILKSLSDVEEHFSRLREIEKTKLRDDFNKAIKEILREMSFDIDIFIDNNFNIMARKKTDTGYQILETQNLSRSEQATIALTLQLALAKGYSPDINIILCDGIYEYFDEERRKKIVAYANDFGKKYDKLIIMTVVKEGLKDPTVVQV